MRGFSILEVVLALAIGVTSIVAVALVVFGTPEALVNIRREYTAYGIANALLTEAERTARKDFGLVSSSTPRSAHGYERSLEVTYIHDDLAAHLIATVRWTDSRGDSKEVRLESVVTDPEAALSDSCSPFVVGKWHELHPVTHYYLTSTDLLPGYAGQYPISDVAASRDSLLAAVATTLTPTDPSLFLFGLGESNEPVLQGAFDNASTTRTGYASVSTAGRYVYAANSFGSASPATCSTYACAQLHIFKVGSGLELIDSLALPVSSPPYAESSGGKTTPAKSLTYYKGYVYLGLEKTVNGQEFNIVDVRNPEEPKWVGGVSIGRSVNDISIRGTRAYLATSDSAREFVVVDVEDPSDPHITEVVNAPGSTGFGLGNVVLARAGRVYAGRTYVGNASELYAFTEDDFETPVFVHDPGTTLTPRSVNGVVVRTFLMAIIAGDTFELWRWNGTTFVSYANNLELPGVGASLACRGNTFYVGGVTENGHGFITKI